MITIGQAKKLYLDSREIDARDALARVEDEIVEAISSDQCGVVVTVPEHAERMISARMVLAGWSPRVIKRDINGIGRRVAVLDITGWAV